MQNSFYIVPSNQFSSLSLLLFLPIRSSKSKYNLNVAIAVEGDVIGGGSGAFAGGEDSLHGGAADASLQNV